MNELLDEARYSRSSFVKRTAGGVALLIGAPSLLAACGGSDNNTAGNDSAVASIPMIFLPPPIGGAYFPAWVKSQQYDKKHNVSLDVQPRSDLALYYSDFASGKVPANGFGAVNIWSNQYNQGVPLKMVLASGVVKQAVIVPASSPFQDITDLKGKRFAIDRAGFQYAWALEAADQAGMDLESDVKVVQTPLPQCLPALAAGKVDAAWAAGGVFEPFMAKNPNKFRVLLYLDDAVAKALNRDAIYGIMAFRQSYLEDNGDAVRNLVAGWQDASASWEASPHDVATALSRAPSDGGVGVPSPLIMTELTDTKTIRMAAIDVATIKSELKAEMQVYKKVGFLDKIPDEGIFWDGI